MRGAVAVQLGSREQAVALVAEVLRSESMIFTPRGTAFFGSHFAALAVRRTEEPQHVDRREVAGIGEARSVSPPVRSGLLMQLPALLVLWTKGSTGPANQFYQRRIDSPAVYPARLDDACVYHFLLRFWTLW